MSKYLRKIKYLHQFILYQNISEEMSSNLDTDMPSDLFYIINYASKYVITLVGLTFSITIIFTILTHRQCHNVSNLLACNTCIAAMMHLIITFIASVYGVGKDWAWAAPYCIARGYVSVAVLGTFCYSYSMQAISHMFFAVFYKYTTLLSWRTHFIMIACNWSIGFFVSTIPLIFIHESFGLEIELRGCVLTSKAFVAAIFCAGASFITPLSIVTMVYGIIFYSVRQSTRQVMPFVSSVNRNHVRSNAKRELKIVQHLVMQSGCISVGGIVYLTNILWQKISQTSLPKPMYLMGFTFMTNSISLMAVLQFIMNKKVKEIVFQYLCRRCQFTVMNRTDNTIRYIQKLKP